MISSELLAQDAHHHIVHTPQYILTVRIYTRANVQHAKYIL